MTCTSGMMKSPCPFSSQYLLFQSWRDVYILFLLPTPQQWCSRADVSQQKVDRLSFDLLMLIFGRLLTLCTTISTLLLPPFHKSRDALPQYTVTQSLRSFLADDYVEAASAGNGQAQSSVSTFMEQRK